MGRTGKASIANIKGHPGKDSKEGVSEDTISKLMKDFTCASLLTNAAHKSRKDRRSSQQKEQNGNSFEEMVSSLKHFHLRPPVNKRTRMKEKKNLQRRTKTVLDNKYNLSVAAINSQKSVVWPGKLNCLPNRTDLNSSVILRPSRLSISRNTDKSLGTSSFHSPIQTSSSEEKTRIAASLADCNASGFSKESTNLSFSKLHKRHLKHSSNGMSSDPDHALGVTHTTLPLPSSIKTQGYRSITISCNNSQNQPFKFHVNHNSNSHSCSPSSLSGYQRTSKVKMAHATSSSSSSSSQQLKTLHQSHDGLISTSQTSLESGTDSINATIDHSANLAMNQSSSTSVNSVGCCSSIGVSPERSCSEEMRMEESNVNELASYFEDLLHIPRKMSVMAEMMYA